MCTSNVTIPTVSERVRYNLFDDACPTNSSSPFAVHFFMFVYAKGTNSTHSLLLLADLIGLSLVPDM